MNQVYRQVAKQIDPRVSDPGSVASKIRFAVHKTLPDLRCWQELALSPHLLHHDQMSSLKARPMETTHFRVDGMTCQGCVKSVTTALQRVPGVSKAQVSLEQESASVQYDPTKTSVAAIKSAVSAAGYDVG